MEEGGLLRPNLFIAPANPQEITVLPVFPPHLCSHWLLLPIKVQLHLLLMLVLGSELSQGCPPSYPTPPSVFSEVSKSLW